MRTTRDTLQTLTTALTTLQGRMLADAGVRDGLHPGVYSRMADPGPSPAMAELFERLSTPHPDPIGTPASLDLGSTFQ